MVIAGKSGGGKTMATNLILARILAQGAAGGVIDRAGHYEFLATLIPGATVRQPRHPHRTGDQPVGRRGPRAELAPEKLEYLLALHCFFLGRPPPDGTYDLEPQRPLPALARDPRRVPPLPADRRAAPRSCCCRRSSTAAARKPAATGTSSSPGSSRSSPRACTTTSATAPAATSPTGPPASRRLAAGHLRHPGRRRRARRRGHVHDRRAPRPPQPPHPGAHAHRGPWGGRTFLVVDEGWKMLERRSTGRWINEQARRSRHNRLFLVAISQQLRTSRSTPKARRSSPSPRSSCCSASSTGRPPPSDRRSG